MSFAWQPQGQGTPLPSQRLQRSPQDWEAWQQVSFWTSCLWHARVARQQQQALGEGLRIPAQFSQQCPLLLPLHLQRRASPQAQRTPALYGRMHWHSFASLEPSLQPLHGYEQFWMSVMQVSSLQAGSDLHTVLCASACCLLLVHTYRHPQQVHPSSASFALAPPLLRVFGEPLLPNLCQQLRLWCSFVWACPPHLRAQVCWLALWSPHLSEDQAC